MPTDDRPPLWKQLLGAAVGGSAAFLLYMGYTTASPDLGRLVGMLVTPQSRIETQSDEPVRVSDSDISETEYDRIARRAQEIALEFGAPVASGSNVADEQVPPPVQAEEDLPFGMAPVEQQIEDAWEGMEATGQPEEPVEQAPPVAYEFAGEPPAYGDTGELPDAGVGLWLATLVAVAGTSFLFRRKLIACARRAVVR